MYDLACTLVLDLGIFMYELAMLELAMLDLAENADVVSVRRMQVLFSDHAHVFCMPWQMAVLILSQCKNLIMHHKLEVWQGSHACRTTARLSTSL